MPEPLTYGSLFTGYGGIDLALDAAGFVCKWQVEIDEDCRKVLNRHWPHVPKYGDIKKTTEGELERVDVIAGGFPCQDVSQAGKRKGFHHEDGAITRSGLWFEFARLVDALRPRYVLAENVPGLLTQPGAMGAVLGELARLGYVGSWRCLRASEFGASHLRKRVFIVAYSMRKGELADPQQQPRRAEQFDGAREREDWAASHGSVFGEQGPSDELADSPSGGRGELRESPRRDGQPDGSGEVLADTASQRREERKFSGERELSAETGSGLDNRPERYGGELAHTERIRLNSRLTSSTEPEGRGAFADYAGKPVADSSSRQLSQPRRGSEGRDGLGSAGAAPPDELDHTEREGLEIGDGQREQHPRQDAEPFTAGLPFGLTRLETGGDGGDRRAHMLGLRHGVRAQQFSALSGVPADNARFCDLPFAPGPNDPRWPAILAERPDLAPALAGRLNARFVEFLMGFPIGFTELQDADAKERRSDVVLRGLRKATPTQNDERENGRPFGVSEAQVLRSEVHGARPNESRTNEIGTPEASGISQKRSLRKVRDEGPSPNAPPQGSELEERQSVEHSDIVQQLSYLVASCERRDSAESHRAALQILQSPDSTKVCLQYLSDADTEGWRGLSRDDKAKILIIAATAARPMSRRTKRLSRLGNAVVWQCAYFIALGIRTHWEEEAHPNA